MHACAVILYIISEELINTGVGRAAQRDIDLVDAVAYCAYQALDNIDGAAALLTVQQSGGQGDGLLLRHRQPLNGSDYSVAIRPAGQDLGEHSGQNAAHKFCRGGRKGGQLLVI